MAAKKDADNKTKELRERLLTQSKHGSLRVDEETVTAAGEYCEGYKRFLDTGKTEREAAAEAVRLAEEKGFVPFERGKKYEAGAKVYYLNREKAVILAVIGTEPVEKGVLISAAHIDSPRLDLKPRPLYEADDLAYFKTHYYGGIKKYQWTTVPLSLHGVVCLADGSKVTVNIGESPEDPQFCVTDLLIHLASEQMGRKASDVIRGENLNLLIGSMPLRDDEGGDSVKLNIMRILNEKYGIVEDDFLSAELEAVPAMPARDIGFDRSLIGAYGHDDRVCAYPSLTALLELDAPEKTCVVCLADKEETGSDGNTGLNSSYLKYFIHDLAEMQGGCGRAALSASRCLSADVNAAYDPNFADVYEKRNASVINGGVVLTKYTGARGKGGTSDASAEYVAACRGIFDEENVVWQIGELGRVDAGGGGTVAMYIANLDVDVVDIGVPVLSMHAPYEIVSKLDVYMTHCAISAFFRKG
ncbi:MAG: aminopeptidase [Ruminococcaceae bacterium]|nr:aminopeptidase [Oscillospiraceae bacterium]